MQTLARNFIGVLMAFLPVHSWADRASADAAYQKKNFVQAAKEYQAMAEQGNAEAALRLGLLYQGGAFGPVRDCKAQVRWLRMAAERDLVDAQVTLGSLYNLGCKWSASPQNDVPKDYAEALNWYRKAMEQGNVAAMRGIGLMYYQGQGVPTDYVAAAWYFSKAADQGDAVAQGTLAAIYKMGRGVPQDHYKAYFWSLLAVTNGEPTATSLRHDCAKHLSLRQIHQAEMEAEQWRSSHIGRPHKGKTPNP